MEGKVQQTPIKIPFYAFIYIQYHHYMHIYCRIENLSEGLEIFTIIQSISGKC